MQDPYLASFKPNLNKKVKILILGSLPGKASLDAHEYYAHPRNLFWPFMEKIFGINTELSYHDRLHLLLKRNIALWDVVKSCQRKGSLDSAIVPSSVTGNDFNQLYKHCPHIAHVYFNGQKAHALYKKHISPELSEEYTRIPTTVLPSTSPANASMTREIKFSQWLKIKNGIA